jgi:hypothetical protein
MDTLNKVLAAMKAEPIEVPADEEGYFAWLKNPQRQAQKIRMEQKAKLS